MLGNNINTRNWGAKTGGFLKKAGSQIKNKAEQVKTGVTEFADGVKTELNKPPSDEVSISFPENGEKINQSESFVNAKEPEGEGKGLSKKGKGAVIGGAVGFVATGGLLGTGAGAWFGSKVSEKGWQGALKDTGDQLESGFNSVKGWCEKTFAPTSTIEVDNGFKKETVATNGNKNAPHTLTIIE